jgi:hypothetical protein
MLDKIKRYDCMLSYNWETKDLVLKIKNDLETLGYRCWYDSDQMHGSLSDRMSEAVVSSEVFIMCVTDKYRSSYNCTFEAKYAFKKKKPIIPLMIENLNLDYWLDFIISDRLYVEFFRYTYDECFEQLTDLIKKTMVEKVSPNEQPQQQKQQPQHPEAISENHDQQQIVEVKEMKQIQSSKEITRVKQVNGNSPQTTANSNATGLPPSSWSSESVQSWLTSIDFTELAEACSDMDGALLKQLYEILVHTPEYFYQLVLQDDFQKLAKIASFSKSLRDLFEK